MLERADHPALMPILAIADGEPVSTIHGGRLDGEQFAGRRDADAFGQHEAACVMVWRCMSK